MSRLRTPGLVLALILGMSGLGSLRAAESPEATALNQRLAALRTDPQLMELAPYERLQAQHAVDALAKARRSQRETAVYVAQHRVEIAEIAARTQAAQQELHQLERKRGDLLVEASRRDAERARQETERLRVQAQIQAEEAERLRLAAEAETLARQDVEDTLTTVTGQQSARLSAARQRDAKLAREEAELISGAKLPASKFEDRGEVFTLAADSYNANSAQLSSAGKSSASALAAYLQATPKASARIEAYGGTQSPAQQRADALRNALTTAGVNRSRIRVTTKGAGTRSRAVEVIVAQ